MHPRQSFFPPTVGLFKSLFLSPANSYNKPVLRHTIDVAMQIMTAATAAVDMAAAAAMATAMVEAAREEALCKVAAQAKAAEEAEAEAASGCVAVLPSDITVSW